MLDLRYVKKLVEMLDESTLDSIEIADEKGLKIKVTRAATQLVTAAAPAAMPLPMVVPMPAADPRQSPAGGVPVAAEPAAAAAPAAAAKLDEVKSPMVGTFYASSEPGGKPFVSVGTRVTKGQVLCIIEAMKIMNEIESDHTGVVKEVSVTDAHPVEYGQVLFRIDPNG